MIAKFTPDEAAERIVETIGGIVSTMTATNGKPPARITVARNLYIRLRNHITDTARVDVPVDNTLAIHGVLVIADPQLPDDGFDIDEGVSEEPKELPPVQIMFKPHTGHVGFIADAVPYALVVVPKPDGTADMVCWSGTPEQHAKVIRAVLKHGVQAGILAPTGAFLIKPTAAKKIIEKP